jgi:hypothetical protein
MWDDFEAKRDKAARRAAAIVHASADLHEKRGGTVIALANRLHRQRGAQTTAAIGNRVADKVRANFFGGRDA